MNYFESPVQVQILQVSEASFHKGVEKEMPPDLISKQIEGPEELEGGIRTSSRRLNGLLLPPSIVYASALPAHYTGDGRRLSGGWKSPGRS